MTQQKNVDRDESGRKKVVIVEVRVIFKHLSEQLNLEYADIFFDKVITLQSEHMENRQNQKDAEKEAGAIKDRYLGQAKKKKKVRKQNERKFVFDWDAGNFLNA